MGRRAVTKRPGWRIAWCMCPRCKLSHVDAVHDRDEVVKDSGEIATVRQECDKCLRDRIGSVAYSRYVEAMRRVPGWTEAHGKTYGRAMTDGEDVQGTDSAAGQSDADGPSPLFEPRERRRTGPRPDRDR